MFLKILQLCGEMFVFVSMCNIDSQISYEKLNRAYNPSILHST